MFKLAVPAKLVACPVKGSSSCVGPVCQLSRPCQAPVTRLYRPLTSAQALVALLHVGRAATTALVQDCTRVHRATGSICSASVIDSTSGLAREAALSAAGSDKCTFRSRGGVTHALLDNATPLSSNLSASKGSRTQTTPRLVPMTLKRLAAVALLALLALGFVGGAELSSGLQKDRKSVCGRARTVAVRAVQGGRSRNPTAAPGRALLDLKKAVKRWGKAKLGTWTSTGKVGGCRTAMGGTPNHAQPRWGGVVGEGGERATGRLSKRCSECSCRLPLPRRARSTDSIAQLVRTTVAGCGSAHALHSTPLPPLCRQPLQQRVEVHRVCGWHARHNAVSVGACTHASTRASAAPKGACCSHARAERCALHVRTSAAAKVLQRGARDGPKQEGVAQEHLSNKCSRRDMESLRMLGTLPPGLSKMDALVSVNFRNNRYPSVAL